MGVPHMTMFGVLGGLIFEGRDHRELFDIVRPDIRWREVVSEFHGNGLDRILPKDLYPDVVTCLESLRDRGYFVGLAGNQPIEQEQALGAMNLPADLVATSGRWGISKPEPGFFARVIREGNCNAGDIVYVGDRVDNDIIPAAEAGMVAVHLVRGPWGYLQRNLPGAARARAQIRTLQKLPDMIAEW
jgi:FMN phosphatase YigB (HAD superfamily)